jgi:hypothetical protein
MEIAGLRMLVRINDGTTVNYAMSGTFSRLPENHVIYDTDASSTPPPFRSLRPRIPRRSLRSIRKIINILGVGYDRNV